MRAASHWPPLVFCRRFPPALTSCHSERSGMFREAENPAESRNLLFAGTSLAVAPSLDFDST
jgi:hypothetical protein